MENEDGQILEGTENTKQIVFEFFEKLYKDEPENKSYQDEFFESIKNVLSDEDREYLEKPLTKQEIKEALISLQNNKTPGPDGLTKELLLFFGMS